MPIQYYPCRGEILICNFNLGGFRAPEMIKARPVVVLSRRGSANVCTVLPFSGTEPQKLEKWHHKLASGALPGKWNAREMWAKCDMLTTVGFFRLDRVRTRKNGEIKYVANRLNKNDLRAIEDCVRTFLALDPSID